MIFTLGSFCVALLAVISPIVSGYGPVHSICPPAKVVDSPTAPPLPSSRRAVLSSFASLPLAFVAGDPAFASGDPVPKCDPKAKNCQYHYWRFPEGMESSDAAKESILNTIKKTYPMDGQGGVDLGGYRLISSDDSVLRYEFYSGLGNYAKFFNGNKPFVDDVTISIDTDGFATVRSSSRVGESDLGVNLKRLTFIEERLREEDGWNIKITKM